MARDGFREGQDEKIIKEIQKTLSTEEAIRIKEQRAFDTLEKGTYAYKIALSLDSLRQKEAELRRGIEKHIVDIKNIDTMISRSQAELDSGEIKTVLTTHNVPMNPMEMEVYIETLKLQRGRTAVISILKKLGDLRTIAGHKDYEGTITLTEEAFNQYVEDVEKRLKALNVELFV